MVNKDKRAIVRTVLSLARALGMKTTAEGIESSEISEVLRRLGCSVGQGYYFARPMTGEAAYALVDGVDMVERHRLLSRADHPRSVLPDPRLMDMAFQEGRS